jgi:hypothetical protein
MYCPRCGSTSLAYIGFTSIECNTEGCPFQTKVVQEKKKGDTFFQNRNFEERKFWQSKTHPMHYFFEDEMKSYEDWDNVIKKWNIEIFEFLDGLVLTIEAVQKNLKSYYLKD